MAMAATAATAAMVDMADMADITNGIMTTGMEVGVVGVAPIITPTLTTIIIAILTRIVIIIATLITMTMEAESILDSDSK